MRGDTWLRRTWRRCPRILYGHTVGSDFLNFINPLHWWKRSTQDANKPGVDVASAISGSYLSNWLQDELKHLVNGDDINRFSSGLSGVTGMLSNVAQIIGGNIKEIIASHDDDFANSFVAVPFEPGNFAKVPLPLYTRSTADGPQLAVVIGPKGTRGQGAGRLHRRARARPRPLSMARGTARRRRAEQWKTDRRTAWVRVSDALGQAPAWAPSFCHG